MTFIDAAFTRKRTVALVFFVLAIMGMTAYQSIPKESEPDRTDGRGTSNDRKIRFHNHWGRNGRYVRGGPAYGSGAARSRRREVTASRGAMFTSRQERMPGHYRCDHDTDGGIQCHPSGI